jgi:DNA polymerase-1
VNVLFLDAYNLIYRARSGFTQGESPVIYNFFRGLRPLVEKFKPDKVYFVLEGNPEHRKSISEGTYKDNRPTQNRNFHEQKASIINIIKSCFPFSIVRHPKLECDDAIATISAIHARRGDNVTIISSDSDFIQLLNIFNTNFQIYNPVKKQFFDTPDYDYVMWKALKGDPTDNIRGIKGVGDKTALKLVNNNDLLTNFLKENNNQEVFEKNVNLIRLVDFSSSMEDLETSEGKKDFTALRNIFENLGFTSILKEKTWDKFCDTFKEVQCT